MGASVLIVDDHQIVSEALGHLIMEQSDLKLCCPPIGSTREALGAVEAHRPDVAVVDLVLADGSGLELVKEVSTRFSETSVLVLSALDEVHYAERALRAGARGYLMKREGVSRLIEAIRKILNGEIYLSEAMVGRLLLTLSTGAPAGGSPVDRLSDRELEVLQLIGNGLKPREIGRRLFVSKRTVESHRDHIRKKLNLESAADVLRFAIEWVNQTDAASKA